MVIPKMTDGALTVKEYAAQNHVSEQSVYAKINRNHENLRGHILRQNGKTLLDLTAQEMLKPTDENFWLTQKVGSLENELRDKTYESNKYKNQSEELNIECEQLKGQLAERDRRIETLEQELSEKNAEIAENKERISELMDKAFISENFEERLNALFAVFEDNASTGVIEKFGKLLTGRH